MIIEFFSNEDIPPRPHQRFRPKASEGSLELTEVDLQLVREEIRRIKRSASWPCGQTVVRLLNGQIIMDQRKIVT